MLRPTRAVRANAFFRTVAKLSRQYLKWYQNAGYKSDRNGERWLLETLARGGADVRMVVDAGANVGKWALMAAAALPDAVIHSLELVPPTFQQLQQHTAHEPRIRVHPFGLAEVAGRLAMHYHPSASAHATYTDYPHAWTGAVIECEVRRGDEFLAAEGVTAVDLLKLDVEGAEHRVLAGLAGALGARRIRFVQFEYGRVNVLTKFLLRDFYELFRGYGYVVGKLFPDYVDFRDYRLDDEDFVGPNYVACRSEEPLLGLLAGTR